MEKYLTTSSSVHSCRCNTWAYNIYIQLLIIIILLIRDRNVNYDRNRSYWVYIIIIITTIMFWSSISILLRLLFAYCIGDDDEKDQMLASYIVATKCIILLLLFEFIRLEYAIVHTSPWIMLITNHAIIILYYPYSTV